MLWVAALVMLAGLTFLFQTLSPEPGGIVEQVDEGGRSMIVLRQDRSGHYLAEGEINGHAVNFLVDTGATDVAVSARMARALGLDFGPAVTVMTAGGPARAWLTRLDTVSIGGLTLRDVRATITPALGEEALLGMSYLRHFSIRQEAGKMIIAKQGGGGA